MIKIVGDCQYQHSFISKFEFEFGTVELSVAFFGEVVYVVLPDNMNMLWNIVAIEKDLLAFLKRLKGGITKLQFVLRFGTQAIERAKRTGLDLMNIQISVESARRA